ncbi:hypothetical protein OFN61_27140, partial [Escherichia coli]|nr:hypothetical protein [Escherichia coli]
MHNIALLTFVVLGCVLLAFIFFLRDPQKSASARFRHVIGLSFVSGAALASAWLIRWFTIMEVQTIAKFDAGLYPYQLTMDGNGLIGIIGM